MKKILLTTVKLGFFLGLGVLCIWLFVRQLSTQQQEEIWNSYHQANYFWLLPISLVWVLSHLFRALRWNLMLHPLGYRPKIHNTFMAVMVGYLANLALPRLGEVSRCSVLTKYESLPFSKSFGTVIMERAFDVLIFLLLFFLMLWIQFDSIHHYVQETIWLPFSQKFNTEHLSLTIALWTLPIGLILFVIYHRFKSRINQWKWVHRLKEQMQHFVSGLKSILKIQQGFLFLVYTALIWICYFLMTWICFNCFTETSHLSFSAAFAVLVFGSVGYMLVQGGIGMYPAIVAGTLTIYGLPATMGYALGWLSWSAQTLMFIIVGCVSLLVLPIVNKKKA